MKKKVSISDVIKMLDKIQTQLATAEKALSDIQEELEDEEDEDEDDDDIEEEEEE